MHPGEAWRGAREQLDEAGVAQSPTPEVLAGEAMERGPIMLRLVMWSKALQRRPRQTWWCVHEFVHADMRSGQANGCPRRLRVFWHAQCLAAHEAWWAAWEPAYAQFREAVIAERFGAEWPWLTPTAPQPPG